VTRILDPLPSLISALSATNKASIFDQAISDQVGSSNIAFSVFLCLVLNGIFHENEGFSFQDI